MEIVELMERAFFNMGIVELMERAFFRWSTWSSWRERSSHGDRGAHGESVLQMEFVEPGRNRAEGQTPGMRMSVARASRGRPEAAGTTGS
jgi:hypothetical protein